MRSQVRDLHRPPSPDDLRAVLARCRHPRTGRRNRALILLIADAGLRASETTRLLVEDWTPMQRSLFVRGGKGQKDRAPCVTTLGRDTCGARKTPETIRSLASMPTATGPR